MAGSAHGSIGILGLPTREMPVQVIVEALLRCNLDVALQAIGVLDWVLGRGGLLGLPRHPHQHVPCTQPDRLHPTKHARTGMTVDAARAFVWGCSPTLHAGVTHGGVCVGVGVGRSQIDCVCSCALKIFGFGLAVTRCAEGIIFFQPCGHKKAADDDECGTNNAGNNEPSCAANNSRHSHSSSGVVVHAWPMGSRDARRPNTGRIVARPCAALIMPMIHMMITKKLVAIISANSAFAIKKP